MYMIYKVIKSFCSNKFNTNLNDAMTVCVHASHNEISKEIIYKVNLGSRVGTCSYDQL